jgi:hypothetical protein
MPFTIQPKSTLTRPDIDSRNRLLAFDFVVVLQLVGDTLDTMAALRDPANLLTRPAVPTH